MSRPDVLTTGQAAKALGISMRMVGKYIDDGMLHGYRVPGTKHRRVHIGSLREFAEQHGLPLYETDADTKSGKTDIEDCQETIQVVQERCRELGLNYRHELQEMLNDWLMRH